MFTGYRAPHRGVRRHDGASGEVKALDTTSPHLRRRASGALSSPVPSVQKGPRSHRVLAPAGGGLQRLHRDPSPARPPRTALPERTRPNGSSILEVPRFSKLQFSFMKLNFQHRRGGGETDGNINRYLRGVI